MAVLTPPKLKAIKLSQLQALLLLGGAFVLAAALVANGSFRLIYDATAQAPSGAVAALQFVSNDPNSDPVLKKFVDAMPKDAARAVGQASSGHPATIFAVQGKDGSLAWNSLGATNTQPGTRPILKIISKNASAFGFVAVGGRKQPVDVAISDSGAVFRVGRGYGGLIGDGPVLNKGRRMLASLNQESFYLEKPEGADWTAVSGLLGHQMELFPSLSDFWKLPGRMELSVSASHTDTVFQPFSLYYRPIGGGALPRARLDSLAKSLLADAMPHPVNIQLPDGSNMQELRQDLAGVTTEMQQNQFGDVVKFHSAGQQEALYAFYTKDGEAWLTTDLKLVSSIYVGNVGASAPTDACHKGGAGGFALIPGSFMPGMTGFKTMSVTIHNLETGLFTICGYY